MDEAARSLLQEYTEALQKYFANPDAARLRRIEELNRRAIDEGHGTLELIGVHHEAAISVLLRPFPPDGEAPWTGLRTFCTTCPKWLGGPEQSARTVQTMDNFIRTRLRNDAVNDAVRPVTDTLEQDARRMAHALHGEAGQLLAVVHLKLAEAAREVPASCRSSFREISALLERIETELRVLSHEIRPRLLDDAGLSAAIESLAGGVARRTGIDVVLENGIGDRLHPRLETTLYRAVEEALGNASRHSGARTVRIALWRDAGVQCAVEDDGKGFNADETVRRNGERGFGLAAMRERVEAQGGTLLILSRAGTGTRVLVTLPQPESAHGAP